MPDHILRVFISGKEEELHDERLIARRAIEELSLQPISSEGRTARDEPMESVYLSEVLKSDIYVGIFGKMDSEGSRKEHDMAMNNNIPRLVFEKNPDVCEGRDTKLEDFLLGIKNLKGGVVIAKFNDVIDLSDKIKDSISNMVNRDFQEYREVKRKQYKLVPEKKTDEVKRKEALARTSEGRPLKLGVATIREFQIPGEVIRGEPSTTSVKIEGYLRHGFVDLLGIDSNGKQRWNVDRVTYDGIVGTLNIDNEERTFSWNFVIPTENPAGQYMAFMGIYEDTLDLPTWNRRLVDYEIKRFNVK